METRFDVKFTMATTLPKGAVAALKNQARVNELRARCALEQAHREALRDDLRRTACKISREIKVRSRKDKRFQRAALGVSRQGLPHVDALPKEWRSAEAVI